jgi:hypothetical protein
LDFVSKKRTKTVLMVSPFPGHCAAALIGLNLQSQRIEFIEGFRKPHLNHLAPGGCETGRRILDGSDRFG